MPTPLSASQSVGLVADGCYRHLLTDSSRQPKHNTKLDSSKLPANHRQKLFPNGTLLISELNEITDSGQYACQAKSTTTDQLALNQVQISIKGEYECDYLANKQWSIIQQHKTRNWSMMGRGQTSSHQLTTSNLCPQQPTNLNKVPPVVEPFSFAKSLHRGQRYNVMCTVVRGDLPVSIRWFKDGRPLEQLAGSGGQSSSSSLLATSVQEPGSPGAMLPLSAADTNLPEPEWGPTPLGGQQEASGIGVKQLDPYSSTLTFASLQSHHRGLYSCEATNEAGRANQSSSLVIHGECASRHFWSAQVARMARAAPNSPSIEPTNRLAGRLRPPVAWLVEKLDYYVARPTT